MDKLTLTRQFLDPKRLHYHLVLAWAKHWKSLGYGNSTRDKTCNCIEQIGV
uniref:Uncharacterized protein n=1 Tax=Arundo donax TaxID=35708 RepID=A0A0A9BPW6_ARUDO